MEIEFRDISYTVRTHYGFGSKKQILYNVSGKFQPGELIAILGPSGAGKTSLLHILSGYKTKGITGSLLVNGTLRDEKWFRRRSCYITQEQHLPTGVTIREALRVAARLKGVQTDLIVDALEQVGLTSCADTKIEKLSGGQRHRTSVALELLAGGGSACFLDEPCSGLDDVAAARMQRMLRRLASTGRTVAVTLHQPPASALALCHRVYVVAAGRCVYNGPPGALVPFLAQFKYHCPLDHNPADFFMELIDSRAQEPNIVAFSSIIQNGTKSVDLCPIIQNVPELLLTPPITDEPIITKKTEALLIESNWTNIEEDNCDEYPVSRWLQFWVLLKRLFLQTINQKKALGIQTLHYLLNAVLLGLVFYDNADDGSMMYNHLKFCVGIVMFFSHTRLLIPVLLFPPQVKLAKKEHFNRWYATLPYYMAMTLATFPLHFMFNFVYILIVYYLSGLPRELWKFCMYVVIGNFVSLSTEGIGLAVGSICNVLIGSIVAPSLTVPFLCLAIYGFDFAKSIPWFMNLLMRTSPMRCGLAAFVIVTFGYGRKPLRCDEVYCHFADPKILLDYLDASDDQLWTELAALVGNIVIFRVVAYLALRKRFAT